MWTFHKSLFSHFWVSEWNEVAFKLVSSWQKHFTTPGTSANRSLSLSLTHTHTHTLRHTTFTPLSFFLSLFLSVSVTFLEMFTLNFTVMEITVFVAWHKLKLFSSLILAFLIRYEYQNLLMNYQWDWETESYIFDCVIWGRPK